MPTIVTKNSSTATDVPTSSDLVQGELAVNVADKRLFTENASATVVELGINPTSLTTGVLAATSVTSSGVVQGTVVTATTNFAGNITGNLTGNSAGTHTGAVTGDVAGNITGSGSSSLTTLATTNLTAGGLAYPTADGAALTVLSTDGSGTLDFISVSGVYDLATEAEAEAGTETGGKIFSPLRVKQAIDALATTAGADIASATAVDLTAATGNTVVITGTTESTSLTMNAGQQMILLPSAAWPMTFHATTMNIMGGVSYTCAAGDRVYVTKDLAGVIRVSVFKQDGTAVVAGAAASVAVGDITGLATGVATFLATSSSANLASAVTDETGSGALTFATSPTFVTPALGTPASGVLTNATGLPNSSVIGLGTAALVATGTSSGNVPLVGTKSSTTTLAGLVERSTSAENVTGTDDTVYPTVAGTKEMIDTHGGAETTLTKTFTAGETSTMTLGSSVTAPVIGVTKEVAQVAVTNNDWDAAAGSYTLEDTATATTLAFDPQLASASYVQSFSVSAQETYPYGLGFNSDGTQMYVVGNTGDDINEYALTTGFDVSTASYTQNFSVAAQDTVPSGITFNTDGTKMFITGQAGADVNEYALSTGFNISTASYTQNFSVSAQETSPQAIAFNTDGTKMFIVGASGDVNEYALTTGFDVSTASYSQDFSVGTQEAGPTGMAFNSSGTQMFIVGYNNNTVYQYTLSSAFNLSTASYSSVSFSVASQETSSNGLALSSDGSKFFITGSSGDDVNEYSSPLALTLGTGSFASTDVGKTIEINSGVLILTATTGTYSETTAPSSTATAASGDWSMYAVVYDAVADVLETSNLAVGFDIGVAAYDSVSFSVASQELDPQGIAFNTDGTKMFIVGDAGDDVNEYALTTGFDVSTASYTQNFSVASQESNPLGITFNTDGTKMFIVGTVGDDVNEYALTTGFDVSTASFTDAFSISAQETLPTGLAFNTDGTKMFIIGKSGDDVNEYALTTGFDVSTASYTQNFSVSAQDAEPQDIAFNTAGTKMFIAGGTGNDINEYTLTTGFDVSTASYTQVFSVSSQEAALKGLAFSTDGTKMYVTGESNDTVFQYSTSANYIPTGYQPCIGSNIDSTYWTDINSLTATNAVGDGNVFYAVSNDGKTTWSVLDNTSGVRPIARVSGGTWQYNSNTTYGSTTWTSATVNTEIQALRDSMLLSVTVGFILTSAAYDSVNYSVASQETAPKGIAFNTDGTKMFIVGDIGKDVNEYTLSVGFDLSSTIAFVDSFSVSAQETSPKGVSFNTDGTKMFIVGSDGDEVNEYALTTGFDVSTASFTDAFDVSSQEISAGGMAFNTDGTKMFIVGAHGNDVGEYALSTGFDVSTASYTDAFDVSSQDLTPAGIAFNADGTKMFVVGEAGQDVNEYALSTGFDVSTASYTQNFSVSSQGTYPTGLAFNADGTKMYVVDDSGNAVYQYSTTGAVAHSTNKMNSTTLNAITDANQISLGTDLDFAVILYYNTGSTVPTYSGTAMNYDAAVLNQGAILGTDYNFDAPAGNKVRITAVGAGNYKIRAV